MKNKVALQLYSIREECQKSLKDTLKKVSEIGYEGVEFFDFFDYDAKELKDYMDYLGLQSVGSHTSYEKLKNSLDEVIRYNTILGTKYIVVPCLNYQSSEECSGYIEFMNEVEEKLAKSGFKLLYHNHDHELTIKFDGKSVLERIIKESNDNLGIELDCYWVQKAGYDCVQYLKDNLNKVSLIHLKDMSDTGSMTEVGTGIVDCKSLVRVCKDAEMEWIVIEQDEIKIDLYESIKISLQNAKKYIFEI